MALGHSSRTCVAVCPTVTARRACTTQTAGAETATRAASRTATPCARADRSHSASSGIEPQRWSQTICACSGFDRSPWNCTECSARSLMIIRVPEIVPSSIVIAHHVSEPRRDLAVLRAGGRIVGGRALDALGAEHIAWMRRRGPARRATASCRCRSRRGRCGGRPRAPRRLPRGGRRPPGRACGSTPRCVRHDPSCGSGRRSIRSVATRRPSPRGRRRAPPARPHRRDDGVGAVATQRPMASHDSVDDENPSSPCTPVSNSPARWEVHRNRSRHSS